jgi:hypothetical protein
LDETELENLESAIIRLVPQRKYAKYFGPHPRCIWELRKSGAEQPTFLLFEVDNTYPHPGSTVIRMTAFDDAAKELWETSFDTGHRCYLRDIELHYQMNDQFPLIVLETGHGGGPGPGFRKQYYAIIDDRVDLVRLEGYDGIATRNLSYIPHFECGPHIPKQTQQEWETELLSDDNRRILRALTWLGSVHWNLKANDQPDNQREDFDDVRLIHKLRASEKVIARLDELAKTKDPWVREAAELALKAEDSRWD